MPAGTSIDPTTISLSKGDYCICTCLFISVVTICIYTKADTTHIAIYLTTHKQTRKQTINKKHILPITSNRPAQVFFNTTIPEGNVRKATIQSVRGG